MNADTHWNTSRPPVGCWVLIDHPTKGITKVIRKHWVTDGSYNLVYYDELDEKIEGEFKWQYV